MENWNGKHVAVVGLGVSNMALVRFLKNLGATVCGRDQKSSAEFQTLGIELRLGAGYLDELDRYDAVFLTPGLPKHLPEIVSLQGKVPVLSEIALFMAYCRAPIYAVTGSSGKTTTTSLVGQMLKASGFDVYVGGNIGQPLIESVLEISADAKVVLELSSFQLEGLRQSPQGAVVTNISPNHLNVHRTMENYVEAKKAIYRYQEPEDFSIFNFDDTVTHQMSLECPGKAYYFRNKPGIHCGVVYKDGWLTYVADGRDMRLMERRELQLLGDHNMENCMAAMLMSRLAGADWDSIVSVAKCFRGVEHRLEKVAEVAQVVYYNDSIATTPARAIAGLKAISGAPLVLICGGSDKGLTFDEFAAEVVHRVRHLLVLGECGPKIVAAVTRAMDEQQELLSCQMVDTMEQAVERAAALVQQKGTVLLSPACASFDQYAGYVARGEHFKELVEKITS